MYKTPPGDCVVQVRILYHDGGELYEGEAAIQLRLFVFDESNIGGRKSSERRQRRQNGLQCGVRAEISKD